MENDTRIRQGLQGCKYGLWSCLHYQDKDLCQGCQEGDNYEEDPDTADLFEEGQDPG